MGTRGYHTMSIKIIPLEEVRERGFKTLSRELGAFNFIRFIQQYKSGYGDYTKERKQHIGKKTVDDIYFDIKKKK